VDGAYVGVLEELHQERLRRLLQRLNRVCLEALNVRGEPLRDLAYLAGGSLRTSARIDIGRARMTYLLGACSHKRAEQEEEEQEEEVDEEEEEEEIQYRSSACFQSLRTSTRTDIGA